MPSPRHSDENTPTRPAWPDTRRSRSPLDAMRRHDAPTRAVDQAASRASSAATAPFALGPMPHTASNSITSDASRPDRDEPEQSSSSDRHRTARSSRDVIAAALPSGSAPRQHAGVAGRAATREESNAAAAKAAHAHSAWDETAPPHAPPSDHDVAASCSPSSRQRGITPTDDTTDGSEALAHTSHIPCNRCDRGSRRELARDSARSTGASDDDTRLAPANTACTAAAAGCSDAQVRCDPGPVKATGSEPLTAPPPG